MKAKGLNGLMFFLIKQMFKVIIRWQHNNECTMSHPTYFLCQKVGSLVSVKILYNSISV